MWLPDDPRWGSGLIVATLCALLGVVAHEGLQRRRARGRPAHFLGVEAAIVGSVFHAAMVAVLIGTLAVEGRAPVDALARFWTTQRDPTISTSTALPALLVLTALAVFWQRLPIVGRWAASDRDAYVQGGKLTSVAIALQLLVRYPLTVLSEESVFRGYLQVDLRWGILAGSAAFTAYHLMQWRTIPSLLPYALAGGVLVEWTGLLWPTALVHYALDAGFATVIVLPAERRRARLRPAGRPS